MPNSTVEINAAIMVASMPACASFLRYFLSKTSFTSSTKSWWTSSRSKRYPKSRVIPGAAMDRDSDGNQLTPGGDGSPKGSKGMYWKLRGAFCQDEPPQITSAKRESGHILKSGDFNVFNPKTSSEREGVSSEQDEKTPSAYHAV